MFKMEFKTDNAAFADGIEVEISQLLHKVARDIYDGITSGECIDSNGNTVGQWKIS